MIGKSWEDIDDDSQFITDLISRKFSPASLKRVLIEFPSSSDEMRNCQWPCWFLVPREGYSLDELRIRFNTNYALEFWSEEDPLRRLLPYLNRAVTNLKILEARLLEVRLFSEIDSAVLPVFDGKVYLTRRTARECF